MDISDAFLASNWIIELDDNQASDLNEWLTEVITGDDIPTENGLLSPETVVNFMANAFVAGANWQADREETPTVRLNLPPHVAELFIEFLAERVAL